MSSSVFLTNLFEQKRTIESLLKKSHVDNTFYLFLSLSAFIITLGLLINNAVIIIVGTLVAPLFVPILSFGMGIAISNRKVITRSLKIIGISISIVLIISFATTFLLNGKDITEQMKLASSLDIIFLLVAFVSGIIAAFALIKENVSATLPGIAIAVALLPSLTVSGIAVSLFSKELFIGSLLLFITNFLGITVASTIVFMLCGFSPLQKTEEQKTTEETARDTITI